MISCFIFLSPDTIVKRTAVSQAGCPIRPEMKRTNICAGLPVVSCVEIFDTSAERDILSFVDLSHVSINKPPFEIMKKKDVPRNRCRYFDPLPVLITLRNADPQYAISKRSAAHTEVEKMTRNYPSNHESHEGAPSWLFAFPKKSAGDYFTSMNVLPGTPQIGHFSDRTPTSVCPQTGQT